jgi:hypothetical protein
VIVRSPEPFLLLKEHAWTQTPAVPCTYLDWAQLNHLPEQGATFGITNLAFVQCVIESGAYPINDHTALYQGCLLLDEIGVIGGFKQLYANIRFANIVKDYQSQTDWRVNHRLQSEMELALWGEGLESRKLMVPALHTCFRIFRDLAQIDTYQQTGAYLNDSTALNYYYESRWPTFYPAFRKLHAYKTDDSRRQDIFQQIQAGLPSGKQFLNEVWDETGQVWAQFKALI